PSKPPLHEPSTGHQKKYFTPPAAFSRAGSPSTSALSAKQEPRAPPPSPPSNPARNRSRRRELFPATIHAPHAPPTPAATATRRSASSHVKTAVRLCERAWRACSCSRCFRSFRDSWNSSKGLSDMTSHDLALLRDRPVLRRRRVTLLV